MVRGMLFNSLIFFVFMPMVIAGCWWIGERRWANVCCLGEYGIISSLDMSGEMHMRRRNEVFGCMPHGRGALS